MVRVDSDENSQRPGSNDFVSIGLVDIYKLFPVHI